MDASAHSIKENLQTVAVLRHKHAESQALADACAHIKRFQAQRFRATYADFLGSPRYKTATAFFLQELYGEKDYTQRDQQFARIATAIERIFPKGVVNTAAALVHVHAMTETLDNLMAVRWLASVKTHAGLDPVDRYAHCWRIADDREARQLQLDAALSLGRELDNLTRKPGLRTLLKVMRGPAALAGLTSLQDFLESGFDAFAGMRGADLFLTAIETREAEWMDTLFNEDFLPRVTKVSHLLTVTGKGRQD